MIKFNMLSNVKGYINTRHVYCKHILSRVRNW